MVAVDLGLGGRKLLSEKMEHSAVLHFSDGCVARIESPFSLDLAGNRHEFSPGNGLQESFQPMKELLQQTVTTAETGDSGALRLTFGNGAVISVEPDDEYEAWAVSGPGGFLVVSMPGGELATWGDRPVPESGSP
jgi:hypothetical protein